MQISRSARTFLETLAALAKERPRTPWFTMNMLAERLGFSWDDTARAALECYDTTPPLVDIAGKAYSVTLLEAGRRALAARPTAARSSRRSTGKRPHKTT